MSMRPKGILSVREDRQANITFTAHRQQEPTRDWFMSWTIVPAVARIGRLLKVVNIRRAKVLQR